jgi:hypothetical protein
MKEIKIHKTIVPALPVFKIVLQIQKQLVVIAYELKNSK